MEPIPETVRTIEEFGPYAADDADLLGELARSAAEVVAIVPECVGLSVAVFDHGLTFTLLATDREIALLDAVQYLDGGPCVVAVEADRVVGLRIDGALGEGAWVLFSRATAARGVLSTLTLPVLTSGRVTGSINLYAASEDAFEGHHDALAEVFGAWAPGAVTNADLSFASLEEARRAPEVAQDELDTVAAAGMIAVREQTDLDTARRRLEDAAARANVPPVSLARELIAQSRSDRADDPPDSGGPTVD